MNTEKCWRTHCHKPLFRFYGVGSMFKIDKWYGMCEHTQRYYEMISLQLLSSRSLAYSVPVEGRWIEQQQIVFALIRHLTALKIQFLFTFELRMIPFCCYLLNCHSDLFFPLFMDQTMILLIVFVTQILERKTLSLHCSFILIDFFFYLVLENR